MDSLVDRSASFERFVTSLEQSVVRVSKKPRLAVIGEFAHFQKSVLGKVCEKYVCAVSASSISEMRMCDASIVWTPETVSAPDLNFLKSAPAELRIINGTGFSPDKDKVQAEFSRHFGYSTAVDPLNYRGEAVCKSIRNARHDGVVITLPIGVSDVEVGKVYERLIDNTVGEIDGEPYVVDIRLPILGEETPLAYLKFRPKKIRFSNRNEIAFAVMPEDVLSMSELAAIRRFSSGAGLNYGELDILRNNIDQKIYIVDANNTPFGPPNGLGRYETDLALRLIGQSVLRNFFTSTPKSDDSAT